MTSPTALELEALDLARRHGSGATRVLNEKIVQALEEKRLLDVAHLWSVWRLLTGD